MARDENDRSYEDGQGRSSNPDLTGDVLSPRWSTEDTDEQPAIQVSGNETYILPLDKPVEPRPGEGVRDVLDGPAPYDVLGGGNPSHDVLGGGDPSHDVLGGGSASRDVLGGGNSSHDVLGGASGSHDGMSGPHDVRGAGYDDVLGTSAMAGAGHDSGDSRESGRRDDDSGAYPVEDEPSYLPLDRGYDADDDDRPRRGFLGSGWTDDSHDSHEHPRGEREVRRRTRTLLVAAAAVVAVGVGVGWMLTGTSADDPCAGGRCASVGDVSAPSESAFPEDAPVEDEEEVAEEPTESTEPTKPSKPREQVADQPDNSGYTPQTPAEQRARPTREPSERPERPRATETSAEENDGPARVSERRVGDSTGSNGTGSNGTTGSGNTGDSKDSDNTAEESTGGGGNTEQSDSTQESAPAQTQAPEPAPVQEENKGLLDILFPWM
ncbi:hypothetical protein ACIBP6_27015 [Nonomuraea terrae]|uniref:hypothetical protein n=1 Tax=Nonomuraea terrae TaxID=2530383 RepID=UPI0037B2FEF6